MELAFERLGLLPPVVDLLAEPVDLLEGPDLVRRLGELPERWRVRTFEHRGGIKALGSRLWKVPHLLARIARRTGHAVLHRRNQGYAKYTDELKAKVVGLMAGIRAFSATLSKA